MVDKPDPTRRRVLQFAGVAIGSAALGKATLDVTGKPASNPPSVEWTRDLQAVSITQVTDGGFGVLAAKSLTKLGADGDTQWTRSFTGEDDEYYYRPNFEAICPARDGGYVITGRLGGTPDGIAVKLAADGTTVWRQKYEDTKGGYPLSIVQRPDTGYAIATGNEQYGPKGAGVLLLSETGEIEANTKIEPETDRYTAAEEEDRNAGFDEITTPGDGGYVLVGDIKYDNYTDGTWHLSLDAALEKEWEYTPENTPMGNGVISLGDGVAFSPGLAGQTTSAPADEFGFSTYTGSGEADGAHEYYGQGARSRHITLRTTSEVVLAGYKQGDSNQVDESIFTGVAPDGETHWEWEPTMGPESSFNTVISTADGGLAAVGETNDGDESRQFVMKLTFDESRQTETETATETPSESPTATATESPEETHAGADDDETATDSPGADTGSGSEEGSEPETTTPTTTEESDHGDDCTI